MTLAALGGEVSANPGSTNVMALSFDELLQVNVDKVYGASKYEQPVAEAPSSVSLISRDEIQRQGYRTLADVLRSVNGVFVPDDRNYSYLGFRGFNRPGDYNSRVLLLVDGHHLNDNVYGQGLYGTEGFLDVDLIERVEVVRGPSSSIYGDHAFFGVVNVITRNARAVDGLETTGEAGGNETYKAGLTYGKQFDNGAALLLSGSWYSSEGEESIYFPEFNSPSNRVHNGLATDSDQDEAYHFFGSLDYRELSLSGGWSWRRKVIPTASFQTIFNDGGEQTTDERAYVDLKWAHEFRENLSIIGRVAYDSAWYLGEYPYYDNAGTRVLNLDTSRGQWLSTDWQLNCRVAQRHTFIFGGDYYQNLTVHQANYYTSPAQVELDDNRRGWNFGLFAQAELSLRTNLLLNAGMRFDDYSTFGGTVNPRLALIYSPWSETTVKAIYGQAFRAPTPYELYYNLPGLAQANPELEPEQIRTYELDWEQQLPWDLRFSAAAYYYQVHNLASQVSVGQETVFENVDNVDAKGIEFELRHRIAKGLTARVSYALQRAEDDATGAALSNSPRHIAKLNLIVPLWSDKLSAAVDLQYYSGVHTLMGPSTDGAFVANSTLFSTHIVKNLEVSASVYNIFDEHQGFSASSEHVQDTIPLSSRTFRLKATYRF